jgi:hypothetical protein
MRRPVGCVRPPPAVGEEVFRAVHMGGMTTRIRTLKGFQEAKVSLDGTDAARAYLKPGEHWNGAVMPVIPQIDLIRLVAQLPGLKLVFSTDCATVIASDGSPQPRLPVVFVAGVGLRCFDLRFAGWSFREEQADEPTLADELLSAA